MQQRLVILGAGESGVGAAILGKKQGFDVFISDAGLIRDNYRKVLTEHGIAYEEAMHTENVVLDASLVVKSPGIPDHAPLVRKLHELQIPVISEIEFAGRYTRATKICITGSNGKTTTTMLAYHMLKNAGLDVGLAGNVGHSLAWQVAEEDHAYYVIELSSFQLDGMHEFKAEIAVLLNITPDHLDRYEYNMQNYIDSKFRIIQNQTPRDYFIYCADDQVIQGEMHQRQIHSLTIPFGFLPPPLQGAGVEKDKIVFNWQQNTLHMSILDIALQGRHNSYNSMAAGLAGMVLNIRNEKIRESLAEFRGVEHRLERFIKVHGIEFINDSKATNVNSTWYALESMTRPVVWIAGGVDKGNDYSQLTELVREKVKAIVCLGVDNSRIVNAFSHLVPHLVETRSMEEAVKAAYYLAKNEDVVLLSPACASFDLFENYEDRGRQFKAEVRNL